MAGFASFFEECSAAYFGVSSDGDLVEKDGVIEEAAVEVDVSSGGDVVEEAAAGSSEFGASSEGCILSLQCGCGEDFDMGFDACGVDISDEDGLRCVNDDVFFE